MSFHFIKDQDFSTFVAKLVKVKNIYGPVARKNKFVYAKLKAADELRLDFDTTILPPKKEFFPTCQTLLTFNGTDYQSAIRPQEKIIFGVHFYDIKAIDITDHLFTENNRDENYLANRRAATIIGSSVQNVFKRAFWGSIGKEILPQGHDAFMTKIKGGYVWENRTPKGEAVMEEGQFADATPEQVKEAQQVNADLMQKCPERFDYSSKEVSEKVRAAFGNHELWAKLAEDCFSCGSCNTTCPTCYCFDVQDKWNVDQKSGQRARYWDACLTEDFAKISLGGGKEENFRETRGDRFRHRVMRKLAYLNEKLGGPACVGCGRCSAACTADIADPVNVINKIMEG